MSVTTKKVASAAAPFESVKTRIKKWLQARPYLWSVYWRAKQQIRRILLLRFYLYDIRHTYHSMHWDEGQTSRTTLAAELLFQYHKLEKGLVMPGTRRFFGLEPASMTMALCRRWLSAGHSRADPIFVGAVETLAAYERRLEQHDLDLENVIRPQLNCFLTEVPERNAELETPRLLLLAPAKDSNIRFLSFADLVKARRSVREFLAEPVPPNILTIAAQAAQLAPSACNRQPCRLLIVRNEEQKRALLAYQNGNRGFGHLVPQVAILTADESCFFDASERHEPYIDGGLFAMSFILSLRDQGVSSCCLNWCVPPATDKAVHKLLAIPQSQRIVMLIAIGYEPQNCMVPRSPRRAISEVLLHLDD